MIDNLKEELGRRDEELKVIKDKNLVQDPSEGDTDKAKSKIGILERELMVQNNKNVQLNQKILELEGLKSNLSSDLEKLKNDNGLLWAEVVGKPNENSNILLISLNEHLEGLKNENNDIKSKMQKFLHDKQIEESLLKTEIFSLKEKANEMNVKVEFANKKADQMELAHKINEEALTELNKDNATLLNQINDYIEKMNKYLQEKEKYELELQENNLKINELTTQLESKLQIIKTLNTEIEFLKINAMEFQSGESQKITEIKKKEVQRNQSLMDQINELNTTIGKILILFKFHFRIILGKQKTSNQTNSKELENLRAEKLSLEKSLNEKVNNLQIKLEESEMLLDQQKISFNNMIEENKTRIDEKNLNELKLLESQSKIELQSQELKVFVKDQNSKMSTMNNNLIKMTEEFQEKERFLIEKINSLQKNAQELESRLKESKSASQETSSEKNEFLKRIEKLKESEQMKIGEIDAFKLELSKYIQSEQGSRRQIQELKNEINKYQENEQKYFSQIKKADTEIGNIKLKESKIQLSLDNSVIIKEEFEKMKIDYEQSVIEKKEVIRKIQILEKENHDLSSKIDQLKNSFRQSEEKEDIKRGGYTNKLSSPQGEAIKRSFAGNSVDLQKKIEDLNEQLNKKNQQIIINSKQSISFKDDYFGESIEQILTTNQKLATENKILNNKIEEYLKIKEEYEKLFHLNQKKTQEIVVLKKQIKSKENERNLTSDLASENQILKQALSEIELNMAERKNDELYDLKEKIMAEAQKILQQQKQEADLEIFSIKKLLMKRSKLLIDNDRKTARFLERISNCQPNLQTDIAAFFNQEFEETNESEIANDESADYLKQTIIELEAENANLFSALKVFEKIFKLN